MSIWQHIVEHISATTGRPFHAGRQQGVGGGSINAAHVISDGEQAFFVKLNSASKLDMFEAEAEGLGEIAATHTVRVPVPLCWGVAEDSCYLVMEKLDLGGGSNRGARKLGEQLAGMHHSSRPGFGWHRDNTIGATPQLNEPQSSWPDFYRDKRLAFQYQLAARHGYKGRLQRRGEKLLQCIGVFFSAYQPAPSLLHGDLWSGNYGVDSGGEPVIFDPAVYYGDREADIAMTELFGGFPAQFYAAYNDTWPLDSGYRVRKTLYNLYHILNHLNLFGGGYLAQAEHMTDALLGECS
jgi:fructosamine-3-kinase